MSNFYIPASASFPQTSENRPLGDIIDDLADYVGGGDRPAAQDRARRALRSSVRMFNVMSWRFNRQQQTITLLNNTSDYALATAFRTFRAALLLDAAGLVVDRLDWIAYEDLARYDPSETTPGATSPDSYTARNTFLTGIVTILPKLGTINSQYPSVRLDYHSRIVIPTNDAAILTVPVEVEEAIVLEAVAFLVSKTSSFAEGQIARAVAREFRANVEREWRDWPDAAQGNQA